MGRPKKQTPTDAARARLTAPPPADSRPLLSFGLTTLNLAIAGQTAGGIPAGTYVYFVGDSASGKTWFAHMIAAEAARHPAFKKHALIYDAAERGALMDVAQYFGAELAGRIQPPRKLKNGDPVYSGTVQELYFHIDAALDRGPCVYIVDSMDSLDTEEDEEKFAAGRAAYEKGDDAEQTGTYGTAKAKANSRNINRVVQRLADGGSILIVISQTRDKIGGNIHGLKSRAGGRALRFYAHVEIWSSVKGPIKINKLGKEREIGSYLQLDIQKNRVTGWEGKLPPVPFLRRVGVDNVGACCDFLVDEAHWQTADKGKTIMAPEFDFTGKREALIAKIESESAERELQLLVGGVWREIEEAIKPNRRPRYE